MIRLRKRTQIILVAAVLLLFSAAALATESSYLFLTGWTSPLPSQTFTPSTSVHVSGPFKLPPDWRSTIWIKQDGVRMSGPYTVTYSNGTVVTGNGDSMPVTNQGSATEITGTFDMDIGPQPSGSHLINVSFNNSGTTLALNSLPPAVLPNEPTDQLDTPDDGDGINYLPSKGWDLSGDPGNPVTYTVGPPPYPYMTVTPDPELYFGNVSAVTDLPFTISNTGGQALSGAVTVSAPFSCISNCSYSILPGVPEDVVIRFAPGSAGTYTQNITFTCIGSPASCQPLSSYARSVRGTYSTAPVPAQVSLCSTPPCSINFGNVNTGGTYTYPVTITNTGTVSLSGSITFSTPEYTCVDSGGAVIACSYSNISGGQSTTIIVQYKPTSATPSTRNDIATFTGGTSQTLTMTSVVNDKPILRVWDATPDNFPAPDRRSFTFPTTNAGTCSEFPWWFSPSVSNIGAGTLTNAGSVPLYGGIQIASAPTQNLDGFSCVNGCTYSGLTETGGAAYPTFRYCATGAFADNAPHSTTVEFKNTQGAGQTANGSVFIIFNAQSNTSPVPSFTRPANADPVTGVFNTDGLFPLIEYGNVLVNTTKTLTITLTNSGQGTLTGTLGPSDNAAFWCSSGAICTAPYNLTTGQSITFEFSFRPTAVQAYKGVVDMGSNAGANGWLTLHGFGARATFAFEADVTPAQYASASNPSGSRIVTFAANSSDYTMSFAPPFTSAEAYWLNGYFNTDQDLTTGRGDQSLGDDYLIQSNNDGDWAAIYKFVGAPMANWTHVWLGGIPFSGNAVAGSIGYTVLRSQLDYPRAIDLTAQADWPTTITPTFTQTLETPVSAYSTAGTALDYGVTIWGSPTQNKSLNFLAINRPKVGTVNYSIDMSAATNFLCLSGCSSASLTGSSFANFPVIEYHPLAQGPTTQPITVNYNLNDGTGAKTLTFYVKGNSNLTGNATNGPILRLDPYPFLDMGTMPQGARRDMNVTIFNDGDAPLDVTRIWASEQGAPGTYSTHFACIADSYTTPDNCSPASIAPSGSRIIEVSFTPQMGSGNPVADLRFTSNASNASSITPISLYGEATFSSGYIIFVDGGDFGAVPVGQTKTQTVVVRNTGASDFGSGTMTIVGPFKCIDSNAGGLDAGGNCKYNLPAGGSTTLTIEFAPKTAGAQLGTMELSGLPGVSLPPLTGIGIAQKIKIIETVGF